MIQLLPKPKFVYAATLNDAYKKGYFTGSITRWELEDRVLKYNSSLKIFSGKTHRNIWDISKGENGFICGLTHNMTIPKFTIMQYDSRFDKSIDFTNEYGELTEKKVYNLDDKKDYILAKSWIVTFKNLIKEGYKVNVKGLF